MSTKLTAITLLPTAFCFVFGGGILLCYGISRINGNCVEGWPFISDTGTYQPESCIFTLILNCSAVFLVLTVHTYYKCVQMSGQCPKTNTAGWYVGMMVAAGIVMVGSFQAVPQQNALVITHLVVAYFAFISVAIYSCLVAAITWRQRSTSGQRSWLPVARIVMATLVVTTFVTFASLGKAYYFDSGAREHASIAQWIFVFLTFPFVLSLTVELRQITSIHTNIEIKTPRTCETVTTQTNNAFINTEIGIKNDNESEIVLKNVHKIEQNRIKQ